MVVLAHQQRSTANASTATADHALVNIVLFNNLTPCHADEDTCKRHTAEESDTHGKATGVTLVVQCLTVTRELAGNAKSVVEAAATGGAAAAETNTPFTRHNVFFSFFT